MKITKTLKSNFHALKIKDFQVVHVANKVSEHLQLLQVRGFLKSSPTFAMGERVEL